MITTFSLSKIKPVLAKYPAKRAILYIVLIVVVVVSAAAGPGRLFLAAHYRGAPLRGLRPVPESLLSTHSITNHRCLRKKKKQRLSLPLLCPGISSSNICAICCFLLPSRTLRGTLVSSQITPGYHRWKWTRHSNPAPSNSWKRCVCLYLFPDLQEKGFVLISSCV